MNHRASILVLMSGSVAAQAIPILISPILTRLYTPKDFGMLALYLSICAVLSVFASGRYDLALLEPAQDAEARTLLFAGLWVSAAFCVGLAGVFFLCAPALASMLATPEIGWWLRLIPLTVFTTACISLFTYWLNRLKKFDGMNLIRILNAIVIALLSLAFAITELKAFGLVLAYLLGQALTVAVIWGKYIQPESTKDRLDPWFVAKKYSRYPKFLIPATLAGTLATESPVLLLTRCFDTAVAGLFSFVIRVTVSPMLIIGNSIGEVYRVRAAEHYQQHGECERIFLRHIAVLAVAGVVPWVTLFFWGPDLFSFVFGEQWTGAGEMAVFLSFAVWFQLISTPLSHTITFNQSQRLDLYLQVWRLVGAVSAVLIGYAQDDYILAVQLYVLVACSYYFGHSIVQYRAAKGY